MNVLIVRNGANAAALDASMLLATYLNTQSINYTILDSSELSRFNGREHEVRTILHDVELAVVLAGDGTILHTARLIQGTTIPLLGLNFGQLGFLANSGNPGIIESVSAALSGELLCEYRTNLQIDVVCHGDRDPFDDTDDNGNVVEEGKTDDDTRETGARVNACESEPTPAFGVHRGGCYGQRRFFALNEITINRGALGRIIDFSLDISDNHIADIRGDGLLIATATGSTAYALSAGGPLVAPSFSGLIVVPLAPHTLRTRALLTGANDVICVTLPNKDANREATLVIDGDRLLFNQPVERVYVRRGAEPTRLLRTGEENFYEHVARTFF